MKIEDFTQSTATFAFKQVKGKRGRLAFKSEMKSEDGNGQALVVEHNGHDHVTLDFRELYRLKSGRPGSRRILHQTLDTKLAVQFSSLLMYLAEERMRDSSESPFTAIVTKEKASFGPNWIKEDYATAVKRTENRKARSHLFGLMKRCVELCDDPGFLGFLLVNLAMWAEHSCDEFAMQKAEMAFSQLGMISDELIN